MALHLARRGESIQGAVSFHGELKPLVETEPSNIKAKVLVCHGEADPFVPPEQVNNFKKEMEQGGVDYTFVGYPDVLHAFTNPGATENGKKFGIPLAYDEAADRDSWEQMQKFFERVL